MDIQKEREAFELNVSPVTWERIEYNAENNIYMAKSKYWTSTIVQAVANEIDFGWKMWQAAKAQAVPEWISTSERMPEEGEEVFVHSYGQVRQATRDSSWAGGFKERNCYGWQATHSQSHWMPKNIKLPEQYHFYYENDAKQKAMLEAQEPAND